MKMQNHPGHSTSAGFTLMELIVGVVVMVGVLAAAFLCLDAGFRSEKLIESRADALQRARVAMALISADLRNACPLSPETPFVGMNRTLGEIEADNLDFATHNWAPRSQGEGDLCEISYYVDEHPSSGEVGLWRRRDPSPDEHPLDGGSREEIVTGVRGLRFEYFDGYLWEEEWGGGATESFDGDSPASFASDSFSPLPDAVRITLALWNPAPRETRDSGEEEPPLLFQTVVHLNLAARAAQFEYSAGGGMESLSDPGGSTPNGGGSQR